MEVKDPVEVIVERTLNDAGVSYTTPDRDKYPKNDRTKGLDFLLTDYGVHVEVCAFHTPRKIEQLSRSENVILIQGIKAAQVFSDLMART